MLDHRTKFVLLITLQIPAILMSLIIFAHLLLNRAARTKPHNHGWCALLIVNFFQLVSDMPMSLSYYHQSLVLPASTAYCVWWTWYEFSLLGIGLFMMAWISIERHILIFGSQSLFRIPRKQWLIQNVPIIINLLWPFTFYLIAVVISPGCQTEWDFNSVLCGVPCYFNVEFIGKFDFLFNIVFPITVMVTANLILVIRLIYKKVSLHQAVNWRHHRKMTVQLWIISSLYLGFWLPVTIVQLIQITAIPTFMLDSVETLLFILYFIPVLLPILALNVFPELIKKIKDFFQKRQWNTVDPVTITADGRQITTLPSAR